MGSIISIMTSTNSSSSPPSVKENQPQQDENQKLDDASTNSSSSPPSVKENQQQQDENQKLDDATLWRMLLDNYDFNDDSSDEDYDDGEREITDEELRQYEAAVNASDGFDVPSFPDVCVCCLITPIFLDDYFRKLLDPFCVAAINHFNKEKNTNYEFVKLEKANEQGCRGLLYYLTFEGRIPDLNTTKIFEARVLRGIPKNIGDDPMEVYSCREKTLPPQ